MSATADLPPPRPSPPKGAKLERSSRVRLGAQYLGERRCRFSVWAPRSKTVDVLLIEPFEKTVPLKADEKGFFTGVLENVQPGTKYRYRLNGGKERADPASRWQPEGVAGPSAVADPDFAWQDHYWCGLPLKSMILYELHVGTFTPEGTFDAAAGKLRALKDLGITAVELMPVAQFPGRRNWGYDGVFPYAVQESYGGPAALKRLVNAAHKLGLGVVLDAVYNHVGPEGDCLEDFAPYYSDRYQTPWGVPFNFDGPDSGPVRRFFIDNVLYWLEEFRIDALRLDAVSAIIDVSARPFLRDLGEAVRDFGRQTNRLVYTIAETNKNDPAYVAQCELGGLGLDAQWNFDFHHALHALLTGENCGYYQDFGRVADLAKAYTEGYVYTGQYSGYWKRDHGDSSRRIAARRLVVYGQNHDETGNRPRGERFGALLSFEGQKLAAAAVVLSPYIPLLFMGEEYGETAPFLFFIDHEESQLRAAVRDGRRAELAEFGWSAPPADPDDPEAFKRSTLQWELRDKPRHRLLLRFYRELIRLRREHPALLRLSKENTQAAPLEEERCLLVFRQGEEGKDLIILFAFGDLSVDVRWKLPAGCWHKILDSSAQMWGGGGTRSPAQLGSAGVTGIAASLAPKCVVVYERSTQ